MHSLHDVDVPRMGGEDTTIPAHKLGVDLELSLSFSEQKTYVVECIPSGMAKWDGQVGWMSASKSGSNPDLLPMQTWRDMRSDGSSSIYPYPLLSSRLAAARLNPKSPAT